MKKILFALLIAAVVMSCNDTESEKTDHVPKKDTVIVPVKKV